MIIWGWGDRALWVIVGYFFSMIYTIKRIIIRPRLWKWKHHNILIYKIHNWNWKKKYGIAMKDTNATGGAAVSIVILSRCMARK